MDEYISSNLIHAPELFKRETLAARKQAFNLNNIVRMELLLWDLELFLQIQRILGDRIVLKGGAAVQFYLPIHNQRTSIDIDMIFDGTKIELDDVLKFISKGFGSRNGLFEFVEHIPKNPKTSLSLHTYNVEIPSVFDENTLRTGGSYLNTSNGGRSLKIEFIMHPEMLQINKLTGKNIFAVSSNKVFNILPINALYADKLSTLGPETIGIQNIRMDEQAKQIYDLWMLLNNNISNLTLSDIRKSYWKHAQIECTDRGIRFEPEIISKDVKTQLLRLRRLDINSVDVLRQRINDFKGLYLNRASDFSPSIAAIAGEQIAMIYDLLLTDQLDMSLIIKAFEVAELCKLHKYAGIARGDAERKIKEKLIANFNATDISGKILKGKNLVRVYWAIVSPDNIHQITDFFTDELKI